MECHRVNNNHRAGYTLPEVLVAVFILGTLTLSIIGLATLGTRSAYESERQTVALGLVNQAIERIRALPYDSIGFTTPASGEPDGVVLKSETINQNNQPYTIATAITLVDDPLNGPNALTEATADYKKVEVTAAWRQANGRPRDMTVATYVVRNAYVTLPSASTLPTPPASPGATPTPTSGLSTPTPSVVVTPPVNPSPSTIPAPLPGACTCANGSACLPNGSCCTNCLQTSCPPPTAVFLGGGMCAITNWTCQPVSLQCTGGSSACVATITQYPCPVPPLVP